MTGGDVGARAALLACLLATMLPGAGCGRGAGPAGAATTAPSGKTGLVYDELYLRHKTTEGHPERPERLSAILRRLKREGLLERLVVLPARKAQSRWITAVHAPRYVQRVEASCRRGAAYLDSRDTPISAKSCEVAVATVGGVLSAVDAVVSGKITNAFCAVRPPGHHALTDRAMGFCIFNNVAIAARYVQKKHKLKKVLIVDWDVHHGNGTQATFYEDPTVMYFSVHQFPFYPGTGRESETGAGKGKGCNINVPLPPGATDADYKGVFEKKLRPAATAFGPDFVLISAGFDAHADDPLGGMRLTAKGFADLTRIVKGIAERCCRGRLVSLLEGGYDLPALAGSVEAHVRVLTE